MDYKGSFLSCLWLERDIKLQMPDHPQVAQGKITSTTIYWLFPHNPNHFKNRKPT